MSNTLNMIDYRPIRSTANRDSREQSILHHREQSQPIHKVRNRDLMEKSLLKGRKENYQRFSADEIDQPLSTKTNTSLYISDNDRFNRQDYSTQQKQQQQQKLQQYQQKLQSKRDQALERDSNRYESILSTAVEESKRINSHSIHTTHTSLSLPFNPITLEYSNNAAGLLLKYNDDIVKYRAACRSESLYQHNHSRERRGIHGSIVDQQKYFNPITGVELIQANKPIRPGQPSAINTANTANATTNNNNNTVSTNNNSTSNNNNNNTNTVRS